jgi:hypothetical protein
MFQKSNPPAPSLAEPVFTPAEIAAKWKLSVCSVRRLFADEVGVLKLGRAGARGGKRRYCTLRIPQSTLQRVFRERSK